MGIRAIAFLLVALLAGFFCLSAWAPATDAEKGKTETSTGMTAASEKDDTPGVQEQEQPPAKIAKKHFPWFWLAAGAVVVGVVLYFTVIKKPEYKLTVAVGTGVSGTPASGVTFYKKGKRIDYSYKFEATYKNLRVYLDGVAVPAAGQIKMDRHHTLAAYADESYFDLTVTTTAGVSGTPAAGTYTYREGTSVAYSYAEAAGYNNLKVTLDGIAAAASGVVVMDKSHALSVAAEKIPEEQIPLFDVTGNWHFTSVCSTGDRYECTLSFIKSCAGSICQRVFYVNPSGGTGGTGFWHYEGAGISFYTKTDYLICICCSSGATALAGRKAEYDTIMDCQGSYSDNNHMSGSFVYKNVWYYGGGGEWVRGTGTWSAYRL